MEERQRTRYLDYLRVFATFAVVMLHVSGAWFSTNVGTTSWCISVVYNSVTRWAVPVFVMISGAVFLGRNIDVKKLYTKYVLRIATAFIFWSCVYAFITDPTANIKGMVVNVLYGHYHMWFLYMIVGLYILIPILRKVTESREATKYFLVLAFVFGILIPQISDFISIMPTSMQILGELIEAIVDKINIKLFVGFVGYFVAGYYLSCLEITLKWRRIICVLGLLGYAVTSVCTILLCVRTCEPNEMFYSGFTANIALFAIGIFVFGKYRLDNSKMLCKHIKVIGLMSKWSFGVYLVHALILNKLMTIIRFEMTIVNTIIFIPVISLAVFVVSMGVSALLHQIPVLKKYIV